MSQANNCGSKTEAVTDREIQTALEVLSALKEELKAHTKRRMDRVPNNVAWNEKVTHIDFDLCGSLESIHGLKRELKHWVKRRLQKSQRITATFDNRPDPHRQRGAERVQRAHQNQRCQ